jgi:glycolate oxidase iron-sulfur subunit
MDAIHFLAILLKEHTLQFSPMQETIGVHVSCSLKNVLKEELLLFELLNNIPDIKLDKINDRFCCGAAGSYRLQYPEIANQLLDVKLDDIKTKQHTLIVSSNFGCSMHFKKGLKQQGIRTVEVLHPISLLARQLIF